MKKVFSMVSTWLLFLSILSAQTTSVVTENDVETICNCYTIVDDCSGRSLQLNGSVTVFCGEEGTPEGSRDFPIGTDGRVCNVSQFLASCRNPRMCLDAGNWEICSVQGCTIRVHQTLPVVPTINGNLIGNGYLSGSSGIKICYGKLYSGPLNNIYSATDLLLCPGDPVILNIPGMSLPQFSGLCFKLTIKNPNGTVVIPTQSWSFGSTGLSGSQVNLTGLFSQLNNQTYLLEMELSCCSGAATCDANTKKSVYITIEGAFAYTPWYTAGFFPNTTFGTPATSLPGTLLPSTPGFPFSSLLLQGQNVYNPNNTPVQWSLNRVNCNSGSFIANIGSGTTNNSNPMTFGGNFPIPINANCECYSFSLTYNDGCSGGNTTDNYFFKTRENCFTNPDDEKASARGNTTSDFTVRLKENPPQGDQIGFVWSGGSINSEFELVIYDANGKVVHQQKVQNDTKELNIPFSQPTGIYYYTIKVDGQPFTGKIAKF